MEKAGFNIEVSQNKHGWRGHHWSPVTQHHCHHDGNPIPRLTVNASHHKPSLRNACCMSLQLYKKASSELSSLVRGFVPADFFFNLLFDQNLPACWGCVFLGSFAKNTLPGFTEINLLVAQPETMALFSIFTCLPRVNYLLALFKNYHAWGQSWGRFLSGPLTNIHLPAAEADFFNLLFDWNLPACWACIFPGFFAKTSFTEITLPVAQPEVTAFSLNLPAHWGWIIYWFFFFFFLFFQNYPAQGWSQRRFFSGFFTDIHLPTAEADFFDSLFSQNLPGCWGCIFLGFFVKDTLPSFTEMNLPVAHPEAMAFPQNLPACPGWIIYWLFWPGLKKPRLNFHWLFYTLPAKAAFSALFPKSTLPGFTEIDLPVAQPKATAFCQNLPHSSGLVQTTPPK